MDFPALTTCAGNLIADHNEWPNRRFICNNSSLSFSFELVATISLERNYWEVINLSFVLPGLYLNILKAEEILQFLGTKNSRCLTGLKITNTLGGLVKQKVHIRLTRALWFILRTVKGNIEREKKRGLLFNGTLLRNFFYIAYRCAWF